jgi:DNA-binding CsgD family transcriptional regulator
LLTEPERYVAARVAHGARNAEIANGLGLSVKTVEKHLSSIYRKLAISSRVELAVLWSGEARTP